MKYYDIHIQQAITIGETPTMGKTYIAKRDIKKGEIVLIAHGAIVHIPSDYTVPIGQGLFINPVAYGGMYLNDYGTNANLGVKNRTEFVAIRDIHKGEEVGPAYFMFVPFYTPQSTADTLHLSSFSQLSTVEKEKYKEYISEYLFRKEEVSMYNKFTN